jgi:hypothetical protein
MHEKLNYLTSSLRIQDRSLLECRSEIFHNTTCHINASIIIIIIKFILDLTSSCRRLMRETVDSLQRKTLV